MNQGALGLIEVIGLTAALEAADTCLKSSNVQLIGYEKVTSGFVTVKIQGDVGAVKAAIDAAKMSAGKVGTVVSTLVIPRPANGIHAFIHSSATTFAEDKEKHEKEQSDIKEDIIPVVEHTTENEDEAGTLEEHEGIPVQEAEPPKPEATVEVTKEAQMKEEFELEAQASDEEIATGEEAKSEAQELAEATQIQTPEEVELKVQESEETVMKQNEQSKKAAPDIGYTCNLCHDPNCPREKGQPRNLCIYYKDNQK